MITQAQLAGLTDRERALLDERFPGWQQRLEPTADIKRLVQIIQAEGVATQAPEPQAVPRTAETLPELETFPDYRITGTPQPISRPRAATGPQGPFRGLSEMAPDDESEPEGLWSGPEAGPMAGVAQKDGSGRSLLRSLAQPFQGPEGKMRLLELLAGAGQGFLASRAAGKAQKQTAASQARANLVSSLSRRGGAQGVQYQPTQGIGQTLLGTLAGAGRMGQETIQLERARATEDWKKRMEEAGAARQEKQVGMEGEQLAETKRYHQAQEGIQGQELGLSRDRLTQEGAAARDRLGMQQKQIDAMLEATRIRAAKAGGTSAQAQQAIKQRQALNQINVLQQLWDDAAGEGDVTKPWNTLKTAPLVWRMFPKAKTYDDVGDGIALGITTAIQGSRPSDTDREVVALMIPKLGDSQMLATGKFKALTDLATLGQALGQQGTMVAPDQMSSVVRFGPDGTPQIDPEALRKPGVIVPLEEAGSKSEDQTDIEGVNFGE